jgi:plasmid stabilization system protein ParE
LDSRRKIIWAPSALNDLRGIFDFVTADHPARAKTLVNRIVSSVGKLAQFPRAGRLIPEIGQSRYRELIIGEYRVFHEVREKEVFIFRVFHTRRFLPTD